VHDDKAKKPTAGILIRRDKPISIDFCHQQRLAETSRST